MGVFYISAKELNLNEQIRASQVRVVGSDGEQLGILPTVKACAMAYEKGLDLVEIAPQGVPPVCRIMDYGKYRFEREKKEKEAKKKQQTIEVKEIQLSCRIDTHDFETKLKHARRFLSEGNKVKVAIKFKGRELAHTSIGFDIIKKFGEACLDIAAIDKMPVLDGRQLIMFLSAKPVAQPVKKKTDQDAAASDSASDGKPAQTD